MRIAREIWSSYDLFTKIGVACAILVGAQFSVGLIISTWNNDLGQGIIFWAFVPLIIGLLPIGKTVLSVIKDQLH